MLVVRKPAIESAVGVREIRFVWLGAGGIGLLWFDVAKVDARYHHDSVAMVEMDHEAIIDRLSLGDPPAEDTVRPHCAAHAVFEKELRFEPASIFRVAAGSVGAIEAEEL